MSTEAASNSGGCAQAAVAVTKTCQEYFEVKPQKAWWQQQQCDDLAAAISVKEQGAAAAVQQLVSSITTP